MVYFVGFYSAVTFATAIRAMFFLKKSRRAHSGCESVHVSGKSRLVEGLRVHRSQGVMGDEN